MPNFKNLKRYVALKIKVDFESGERAGRINPRDPGLYTLAQNLEDGYEIRLVLDNRDISVYQGVEGVEVIEGVENIDAAIDDLLPDEEQYLFARDDLLVQTSILAKHQDPNDSFNVNDIPDDTSELDVQEDGVYINDEKLLGKGAAKKLAKRFNKKLPFTISMSQLSPEQRSRIVHIWLMKHGVKGIRMLKRVKKLSELISQ